jgi:hypothetical protein
VTLKDGIDQLFKVMQSDEFVFVVKDEERKITIAEAVLISSKVHENLRSAPENHRLAISEYTITKQDFICFLDLVHSDVCDDYSETELISFLLICKVIGNESLTFLLLDSLHLKVEDQGNCSTNSESNGMTLSQDFHYCTFDTNHCASHSHEYSVELLRLLNRSTLHEFLGLPEVQISNEDSLFQTLIELGSEYFEYWCYIKVNFLSPEGISLFVEHLTFDHQQSYKSWRFVCE